MTFNFGSDYGGTTVPQFQEPAVLEFWFQIRPKLSRRHAPEQPADLNLRLQVRPELARCHADGLVGIDSCRLIGPELQNSQMLNDVFVCRSAFQAASLYVASLRICHLNLLVYRRSAVLHAVRTCVSESICVCTTG